ncbi:MAG: BamA/TamA family outer membrane protein, partial [Gammaproteobacteria bacterium]
MPLKLRLFVLFTVLSFPLPAAQQGRAPADDAAPAADEAPQHVRIRNIEITTRDVFAREDAARRPLYRLFNGLHWSTREEVIRRELWFKEGDVVTQPQIEELERNLRALGIFGEVRIEQLRVANGDTDLRIVTRDRFSFIPIVVPFSVGGVDGFQAFLSERNLFGKGDRLTLSGSSNTENEQSVNLSFTDLHFFDTWHRMRASVSSTEEGPGFSLGIDRPFKHLRDPWSWGGGASSSETEIDFFESGDSVAEVPVESQFANVFLAHAGGPHASRRTVGFDVRYSDTRYGVARGRDAAIIRVPNDISRASVGPFFRFDVTGSYDKAERLDTLDFTQDVRLGLRTELLVSGSYRDERGVDARFEPLASAAASLALKPLPATYFTFAASGSARWHAGETQGWSQSAALHAFQQSLPRQTLAANISYDEVFEREELTVQITLGEDNGLRGYPARQFSGTQRLRVNVEDRIDTGLELRSVHLGLVLFFDAGWI